MGGEVIDIIVNVARRQHGAWGRRGRCCRRYVRGWSLSTRQEAAGRGSSAASGYWIHRHASVQGYLILVDDICKDSDWETIKGAFPANYCGSRLLFTTRNELKAGWFLSNYDGTMHKMKPLNDSYSERLLRIKAFDSMDYCPPDNLKILCDEILKKCRGIPLFITSMAEWLKQHQNSHNSFAVPTAEQVRLLFKQFDQKLSFNYSDELSPALCLSMFPHGYVFDKDHFAMKWLEEGLAGIRSGIRLDTEQAKMSFTEMVDKNIISPVSESCGLNLDEDELCQWQVNPFMLNFLASKAAEKGFVFTSSTLASATAGGNKIQKARRLALHHPHPQLSEMLKQMDLSHTRSLLISGAIDRLTIPLGKFAYLVVLDLHGWENLKDDDLLQICKMFFLTYLSIRCTSISKLPPQIKQLRILSTLDISHTHIRELPLELCELHCLNMLDLRATKISQLPEQIGRLSYRLRTLLIGGHGIINSNETVVVIKIPHSLMTVLVLNTLATVDLSDCPASFVEVIGRQGSLEVIAITWPFNQCTDEAYQDALRSSIQRWLRLRSLTIHCGFGSSMEFLDSLNNPPKNLHKLKVTAGRFVNVPQWIKWLQHLAFLQIIVCKLEPDDVKILECLRGLKCLVLGLESVPKEEIVIESDGFSWLERFSLDCPVPWLTFKQGTMPRLMYLELKICSGPANQVNTVPSGLTNLPRIKEVVICYSRWCRNSSSVKMTVEAKITEKQNKMLIMERMWPQSVPPSLQSKRAYSLLISCHSPLSFSFEYRTLILINPSQTIPLPLAFGNGKVYWHYHGIISMELAVGASDDALRSLLGKLGGLLAQEYTLISGVRSEIQYMNDELASMRAFLRSLERSTDDHDEQTKDWVEQVRDIAYDIEDCVDDFSHRLGCQPRGEGILARLRRAWYVMETLWARRNIATKVIDLKNRAQDVGERRTRYGVRDPDRDAIKGSRTVHSYDATDRPQPPPQLVGTTEPIGMEDAIAKLGPWLTSGEEEQRPMRILAIVGFGGLGKTTLALALHRRFGEKFDSRASVQASQKLNLPSLLRSILKQVMPQAPEQKHHKNGSSDSHLDNIEELNDNKQLREKLKTHLDKKRYLLLIDDVWSVSAWENIWVSLPKNTNGSTIVVTTRFKSVAEACCRQQVGCIHILERLPADKSRTLFKRIIGGVDPSPNKFEEIKGKILKKCGGFIAEKHGKTVEEVAEDYFNEIISRNIVRPVDHSSNGKVKTCQVHDMILEYILSKSSEENFITVVGGHWVTPTPSNKVRRLSLHSSDPDHAKAAIESMNLSHVRSLTAFDSLDRLPSFSFKFRILQVLDLEGCKGLHASQLDKICKMFHLKYLSLRKAYIKKLPSDIGRLQYLETLDIRETNVRELPASAIRLQHMAHLLCGNKSTGLALRFTEGIAKMVALQTLSGIEITKSSIVALIDMHNLTKLKKLSIYNLTDFNIVSQRYDDLLSAIEYLSGCSLKSLIINDGFTGFVESMVSISTPPKYIRSLELSGKLPQVPGWIKELENLEKLTLSLTSLTTDGLLVLSQLPSLFSLTFSVNAEIQDNSIIKVLQKNVMDSGGKIFVQEGGFDSLKLLRFSAPVMPPLSFLERTMTNLQRVELRFKILEGIYGVENLESLQQVHLRVSQQASESTMVKVSDIRSSVTMHPRKPTMVVDQYYD
uniref:NB-ARC domain-containing protein n=1 Tax=Leersia perrieri TaxID=77586 RepID=A0A0D9XU00_9ORYZ